MIGIKLNNRNVKNFEKFEEEVEKEKENNNENFKRLGSQSTLRSSSSKTMHKSIWSINNNKNVILKMNEMIRDYPEKYYKQYLKSDIKKLIKNICILFFHPIIILIYLDSYHACPKKMSLNDCIEKLNISYYYVVAFESFICGVLMSLIVILTILRIIYFWQIFIVIVELLLFICLGHKNDIYTNGLFSFKLLIEFMGISFMFFLFFSLFIIKLRKRNYFYATFFFFAFH